MSEPDPKHIARLANLLPDDGDKLSDDFNRICAFVETIMDTEVEGDPPPLPFERAVGLTDLRDDKSRPTEIDPFANTTCHKDGHFCLPRTKKHSN